MDVSGCGFLEADQKAAGFVLTCTPAGATPARRQGRLCDSAALRQRRRGPRTAGSLRARSALRLGWPGLLDGLDASAPGLFDLQARPNPLRTW